MDIATQRLNPEYTSIAVAKDKAGADADNARQVSKGIQSAANSIPEPQLKAFLSTAQNSGPLSNATTTEIADPNADQTLEDIKAFLDSTGSSDAARLLGRLLVELGALQRKEALNDRLLARSVARAELEAGADKLRDASEETKRGAMIALVITAVASVAAAAMGGAGLYKAGSAAKGALSGPSDKGAVVLRAPEPKPTLSKGQAEPGAPAAPPTPPLEKGATVPGAPVADKGATAPTNPDTTPTVGMTDNTIANTATHSVTSQTMILVGAQTLTGLSGASAGMATAKGQSDAQIDQALQADLQAEAEVTKSEGELEASEQQALQEFINQMIQFIKEMRDAEVEQLAVVTRG